MTTKTASATVIPLRSRRTSRADRRSRALREAMRRHPSYQGFVTEAPGDAVIIEFRAPAS